MHRHAPGDAVTILGGIGGTFELVDLLSQGFKFGLR